MKNHLTSCALIVILAGLVSATAQTKSSTAEDAIRAADQGWARVFGAKDLKASVDYCASEASFMAPNSPAAIGRQAIGQAFAAFFAFPDIKIDWQPTKIAVARSGELGYSSGIYEMTFKDPAGKTMTDRGKYVTIWQKQNDSSWKVVSDIFNSDLPATPPS